MVVTDGAQAIGGVTAALLRHLQALIALVTAGVGLTALVAVWLAGPPSWGKEQTVSDGLLSLALVAVLVLSFRFPIHIRSNTKICMNTVPLYLAAALLTPSLAAITAAAGMMAGELSVQRERGTTAADIVTQGSRWLLLGLLGSTVGHVPLAAIPLHLVGAAAAMWAGDILSSPLLLADPSGEPPLKIITVLVREVGLLEGAQYLVGLLGALVVRQEVWAIVLLFLPTGLVYLAFKRGKEMNGGTRRILESMADTVDFRDPYTGGHSRRVTELTAGILQELGKQGPGFDLIVTAARVHDIGKIGLPDRVLMKESDLSAEEWEMVKTHPDRGAELLEEYPSFARGADIVRHHHERWDGRGYPHGLRGTDIPFGSRVIAVADSFDAMTTDRPYRRAMSSEKAMAILAGGRGREWDAAIVDAFLKRMAGRRERTVAPALRLVPDGAGDELDSAITA